MREIGWGHNVVIMENIADSSEKEFCIQMAAKFGWSRAVLIHNIEAQTYRKYLANQTNFDAAVPEKVRAQAKLAVKDEYAFDFLELGEEHNERELEGAVIAKVGRFLREMGGVFTFAGSQYRLEVEKVGTASC